MDDNKTASALERFEQDEARIRTKIRRTMRQQSFIWWISIVAAAGFFGWIGMAHHQQGIPLEELAAVALPLLMVVTILITTLYIVFIFLYFSIGRRIYHSKSVNFMRLNEHLHPDEHHEFVWHSYFWRDCNRVQRRMDAAFIVTLKVFKLSTIFALIVFLQFAWMELMDISGQEMADEHYAYLGLIDLTLFSVLVLFIIVLITIRIGKLGQQKDPHGKTGKGNYYEPDQE